MSTRPREWHVCWFMRCGNDDVLKIETSSDTPTDVRLLLSGWISGAHVEELERLLDEVRRSGRRLGLDLGSVTLADREVVEFFARGAGREVRVERCPVFLREWIRREAQSSNNR